MNRFVTSVKSHLQYKGRWYDVLICAQSRPHPKNSNELAFMTHPIQLSEGIEVALALAPVKFVLAKRHSEKSKMNCRRERSNCVNGEGAKSQT